MFIHMLHTNAQGFSVIKNFDFGTQYEPSNFILTNTYQERSGVELIQERDRRIFNTFDLKFL